MQKHFTSAIGLAIASVIALSACAAPAAPAATTAPAAPAATEAPAAPKIKVGLVTDVGSLSDKSFNAAAWAGVQRAVSEWGIEAKAIESKQPTDYQKNIEQFVNENYDLVITVGFLMGDDTKAMGEKYPNQKIAIVDVFQDDKAPKNVLGLTFAEDQSGFLAGALAALVSKTGKIGSVVGINIPPVCKFKVGYEKGAKYANPNIVTFGVYQQPGPKAFNDPEWGKEATLSQLKEGADIVFAAGGQTGNGGLLGIAEQAKAGQPVLGIGVDQDQFMTLEGARPILLTSAMKRVDQATYLAIKDVIDGKFAGGNKVFDMSNDGVGLAPFHDNADKVSADVQAKIDKIAAGMKDGSVKTGVVVPDDCKE
jgi:basic membrane protein A